jgi:hypothetical protein
MSELHKLTKNNNKIASTKSFNNKKSNKKVVDLSKLDCSEKTMSLYTYHIEFLKLDLDKIREFIDILEEYYQSLIYQQNMTKAKSVKQRLILLKNIEKEKMKKEAKIIYSNQRELIQDKMKEEIDNYINNTSKEFDSLLGIFESQKIEMIKAHKQEKEDLINNFDQIYEARRPKPSKKMLNLIRMRDYAAKQNNFDKLEEVNKEIIELQQKEDNKFESEKESNLKEDLKKMNSRHESEKKALQNKKNNLIDIFNQTKNKKISEIEKKYDAKMKELKNYQSFEMASFEKITRGITKPCSRIQSIVNSTSGIGEDENDDMENEKIKDKIYEAIESEKKETEKIINSQEENNINEDKENNEEYKEQEIKNDIREENELEEKEGDKDNKDDLDIIDEDNIKQDIDITNKNDDN